MCPSPTVCKEYQHISKDSWLTQQNHSAWPFLLRPTTNSPLLWNSNVHCHINKSHLLNYILNQFNLVYSFMPHFTYSKSNGNQRLGFGFAAYPWTCSKFPAKILAVYNPLFLCNVQFNLPRSSLLPHKSQTWRCKYVACNSLLVLLCCRQLGYGSQRGEFL
jgi:hypothetical protein